MTWGIFKPKARDRGLSEDEQRALSYDLRQESRIILDVLLEHSAGPSTLNDKVDRAIEIAFTIREAVDDRLRERKT